MNAKERVSELRQPLTMSMFLKREHLYEEQERQRQGAASLIERQAEAIRVLQKALKNVDEVFMNKFVWKGSSESNDGVRRVAAEIRPIAKDALAQTKEFGE